MVESDPSPRFSADLRGLRELAGGQDLAISEVMRHTGGRGLQMLAIVLSLPFLSPVAIPGLSIPFGAAIGVCGLRIAFRRGPWLPDFVARRKIPFGVLDKTLRFGIAIHARLERFLRPRWAVFVTGHSARMASGLVIAFAAVLLSLPIPPPFPLTNTLPGFSIILVSLGMIERDGLVIFCGQVLCAVAAAYVTLIAVLGGAGAAKVWELFGL
jgi:hypothetical protein